MRVSLFLLATTCSAYRVAVQSDIGVKEAGSETEVCCLCFEEDGEKTTWDIKTFDDDSSAELQGAGFMDCRRDQGDGTSKCSEYCASLGFQMKGCMKSAGMTEWRDSDHWAALTTSGENSWTCRTDAEGDSCACAMSVGRVLNADLLDEEEGEEEEEEEEAPALIQKEDNVGSETEVCCLCFDEDGEKTTWDVKTFDDDDSATLQGAGFKDCRHAQEDGTSKCEAYCASLGFQMKGCEKSHGMFMWRGSEHWSAMTTSGENSWICRSDAEGPSCECPGEAPPAAAPEEDEEEEESLVQQAAASETEVCCLCFEEDGEKTIWDIKTFDDDESSERQGAGFMDCRQDQGDGTSKCSEYCASLGYEMKGCMKSAGMMEWRENEFWSALTTSGANSWSCRTDAEDISCGCPEDATPA